MSLLVIPVTGSHGNYPKVVTWREWLQAGQPNPTMAIPQPQAEGGTGQENEAIVLRNNVPLIKDLINKLDPDSVRTIELTVDTTGDLRNGVVASESADDDDEESEKNSLVKCPECPAYFESVEDRVNHKEQAHRVGPDEFDGFEDADDDAPGEADPEANDEPHTEPQDEADEPGADDGDLYDSLDTVTQDDGETYVCRVCDGEVTFDSEHGRDMHERDVHDDEEIQDLQKLDADADDEPDPASVGLPRWVEIEEEGGTAVHTHINTDQVRDRIDGSLGVETNPWAVLATIYRATDDPGLSDLDDALDGSEWDMAYKSISASLSRLRDAGMVEKEGDYGARWIITPLGEAFVASVVRNRDDDPLAPTGSIVGGPTSDRSLASGD